MNLINRPCELIYRFDSEEVDEAGDAIYTEERVEADCEVQHRSSFEGESGAPSSSDWVGFFFDGVDLEAVDAVNVPDEGLFEIDGDPARWRSPLSRRESFVEVSLVRVGEAEEGS